ncbi:MAG: hypothetical protein AB1724_07035 [Thermodesulfobacteriota bacterium]
MTAKVFSEEAEKQKKAIFDSMAERSRKRILKMGYAAWNPFEEPKDPIDIRKDVTKRTSQALISEFLQSRNMETYSNQYGRGVVEICLGLINKEDRFLAMFEFSCWYKELLEKEGATLR